MISVTAPIERAFSWMQKVLFSPFDIEKWFVLGFCAFLASLAGGGSGGGGGFHSPLGHDKAHPGWGQFEQVSSWVTDHLQLILVLAVLVAIFVIALVIVCSWLGSRGQFMFLDGVARNRAAVAEPWHRYREIGNDLFIFRVQLFICSLLVVGILGLLGWMLARPDILARHFGSASVKALLVVGAPLVLLVLALLLVSLLLSDFVVPIMYRRGIGTGQAFGVLWREIIPGHGWEVVLYFLMKCLLLVAAGVIIFLGTCCTCCLAALPYVGSVVFLPVSVFFRAYSLYFLEQFGEEWRFMGALESAQPQEG